MDIDFGQILPNPTNAGYDPAFNYSSMQTCLDGYQSEWLSQKDDNRGHALPGYNADGSAKSNEWWRCIVNVKRAKDAADNADTQAAEAEFQAGRARTYLDNLGNELTEDAKAQMLERLLTPHVEGSTLVFPANSSARVSGSTLILAE